MRFFITLLTFLTLTTNITFALPYKANAKTARIPAGTRLSLELLQTVDNLKNCLPF